MTTPLVISDAALREFEHDVAARQSSVDLAVGIQTVVDATTLLLIQDDLDDLAAILLGADALADNLNGVDDIGQDRVVDGGQSARARTLLLQGVARPGRALGTRQDAPRGNEDHMAVRELLLKLPRQPVGTPSAWIDRGNL